MNGGRRADKQAVQCDGCGWKGKRVFRDGVIREPGFGPCSHCGGQLSRWTSLHEVKRVLKARADFARFAVR